MNTTVGYVNSQDFDKAVTKLRAFCKSKGFVEVHTQSRLSILAACEDPENLSTFNYAGSVYPLPQTGQMWLEHELLSDPSVPGYFCLSTSYRNEPDPVPGRHDLIFPMFEFEIKGDLDDLIQFEKELLEYVGFKLPYHEGDYDEMADKYGVKELENEHEAQLEKDYGPVFFLKNFPNHTSPFWNMKQHDSGTHAKKIDVIIHGIETIGSAERSTNADEMRDQFYNISEGHYAKTLFGHFTKPRVEKELNEFLSYDFMPRSGGGIGMTRMIRAMKLSGLL